MGGGDSEMVSSETNGVDHGDNMNPMTIDELDVEDDYVIQHGGIQKVEVTNNTNNNENTILELKRLVQTVASSVATAVTKIEELSYKQLELSSTMMEFQHHNKEMRESLKLMEVVVCLKENDVYGSNVTPSKIGSDAFDMFVGKIDNHISPTIKQESGQKRKSKATEINDDNNVIVDVSDSEDDSKGKKVQGSVMNGMYDNNMFAMKPPLPKDWTTGEKSGVKDNTPAMMLCKSNFRRPSNSEPTGSTGLTEITKKLFQSPSHKSRIPVTNPYMQSRRSPVGRGKTRVDEVRPFTPRVMNLTLPRGIKWRFKTTPEMHLSPLEVQVCAYVFHPDQDAK